MTPNPLPLHGYGAVASGQIGQISLSTSVPYVWDLIKGTYVPRSMVIEEIGIDSPKNENQPNVIENLNLWDKAQGERVLTDSQALKQTRLSKEAVTDFHAAAFQINPKLVEESEEPRFDFIKALLNDVEYRSLREATKLNPTTSQMAAVKTSLSFWEYAKKQEKEKEKRKKDPKNNPEPSEEDQQFDTAIAARRATKQAKKEVEEFQEAMAALGLGGDGGDDKGHIDPKKSIALFQSIQNQENLRRIINRAGRFRLFAQGKQRQKVSHGYEDMVGICLDDSLDRLIEEELVLLLDKDTEPDALRRLSEREMLARDYRGSERVGKGPIVVCVDESGSMSGDKIVNAKAFALAMAWIAIKQKRWCCLIGYSGGTEGNLLAIPPNNSYNREYLLNWLSHFYSGGTTMDVPLVKLPTTYWEKVKPPKGKTDVIIITDAIVRVPEAMRNTFNDWKKQEKVRCISLILGHEAGELASVSDEVHLVKSIDTEETGVEKCLSI